jgi:hypothetical protein
MKPGAFPIKGTLRVDILIDKRPWVAEYCPFLIARLLTALATESGPQLN